MLALDRSFGVVADLALFGDHAEPGRVYYVPTRPRVARHDGEPMLSLIKVRSADAVHGEGAGLLLLSTVLTASDEQLEQARRALQEQGVAEPALVRAPFIQGKAVLVAALREGDGFVERMFGEVTPDLLGDGRAVFSLSLNEEGTRLLEAALAPDAPGPVGVRYELELLGLRPALAVKMRADYRKIHDELSVDLGLGVAISGAALRARMSLATKKLVNEGAIEIEVLRFSDDEDLREQVDQALQWFQEQIIDKWFDDRIPDPARGDLWARATQAARAAGVELDTVLSDREATARLAEQLGVSPQALRALQGRSQGQQSGAELSLRSLQREQLGTVEIDWTQAQPERRTMSPQGMLAEEGLSPRILEVDPRDDLWARLDVDVRPQGDFASLGVQRLLVRLAHPDPTASGATHQSFAFASGDAEAQHFAVYTGGGPRRYATQTEVLFDPQGPWPGPPSFVGAWESTEARELVVHPLVGVPRVELELAPGALSWQETPQVRVDVRVGEQVIANVMLTAASPRAMVRQRLAAAPALPGTPAVVVQARATWFLEEGASIEGDWTTVEGSVWLVQSPWRSHRTIRVLPVLPPDTLDASVTLRSLDDALPREVTVELSATSKTAAVVSLPSRAETPPPFEYETLVVRADGSTFVGDPTESTDPVVVVRDREGEHRRVPVRLLAGPSLAAHGVIAVEVQLLDRGDEVLDRILFTESRREPDVLFVPLGADGSARVRHRVVRYGLDGQAKPGGVIEADSPTLLVPAVAPPEE